MTSESMIRARLQDNGIVGRDLKILDMQWIQEINCQGQDEHKFYGWNNYDISDPMGDVEEAKRAIIQRVKERPSTLVMSYPVYFALRTHPQLTGMNLQFGVVNKAELVRIFDVDTLKIDYNTDDWYCLLVT